MIISFTGTESAPVVHLICSSDMAIKKVAHVTKENGDFNIKSLWDTFGSNPDLQALSLTIRTAISEEESHQFNQLFQCFGIKLKYLEVESVPPIEKALDPKSFDNLTSFTAVHEFSHPVSKLFLQYLCNYSPAISKLSVRCEADALSVIGSFSCLKYLNISLVVPWWLTDHKLSEWSEAHVVNDLVQQFNKLAPKLETFVIFARRIRIPWSLMDLSNLIELDVDTGLFRQLLLLTHGQRLKKLSYSYYGTEFSVCEIDDWEVLMEHMHKLSSVRFRISNHFKDRADVVNWIVSFAEDWPNTMFKVDDYWNEDFAPSPDADPQDDSVVYQTRSNSPENGTAIAVVRSENVLVKVSLEEQKHYDKFQKQFHW